MHQIEPFYNWLDYYTSEEDKLSPFYGVEYNQFEYHHKIYNYYIHPQWDDMGSETLFIKILYADYEQSFAIIELIGEWNDAINNDVMTLKREIIDELLLNNINKYIIIGENVFNFHASDNSYYEEWHSDIENGWITFINFREHVLHELEIAGATEFINYSKDIEQFNWRAYSPYQLFKKIDVDNQAVNNKGKNSKPFLN